jgi:hypothetical protein
MQRGLNVKIMKLREHASWGEVPQVVDVAITGSNAEADTPESNKPLMH